jgi:hypothetical protein
MPSVRQAIRVNADTSLCLLGGPSVRFLGRCHGEYSPDGFYLTEPVWVSRHGAPS